MIENIQDLIPKDKHDLETAEQLKNYTYDELKEIIPDLLEWLQDINWPVAKPVSDYLKSIHSEITDELLFVLKSDDGAWKYWVITVFGPVVESVLIQKEILRIAHFPTKNEKDEEMNLVALEIVENRNWN